MKMWISFASVLLLGAALADAMTVKEAIDQRLVGCPDPDDFNACLTYVVDSVRGKVVDTIVAAESDTEPGTLPEQQLGPITLSGTGITYSGTDTIEITDAQLEGDVVTATLSIGHINFDGNMLAKVPIVGAVKAHLNVKLTNLKAKLILTLAVENGELLIKKARVKVSTDTFAAVLNNGGPLTRPNGKPITGPANAVVQRVIRGMNNKSTLEKRIVPLAIRTMMPFILKRINGFIAELPTL